MLVLLVKITNSVYVFFIASGLIGLVNFALGIIADPYDTENVFLNFLSPFYIAGTESLIPFMSVLIAWTIAGVVAGAMEKKALQGASLAFLSLLLSFIAFFLLGTQTGATPEEEFITGALMGGLAVLIIATFAGYLGGMYTYQKEEESAIITDRKVWKNPKYKDRWKCQNCGTDLPPGAMNCPRCGKGAIE